ncbi:hypothetical protein MBRA1_002110 [Malassezia brasiliensis]|uniref:N-alpha-acetyltransferase 16, NatA auxiliary subunit n=1 Tax=Malassezia brasiliensis TaxID=1821822 RepID=A0AAF0INY5_9BASI|nr:hypothetical protein MBRA1_002110 [Malassezia brasiliensis]
MPPKVVQLSTKERALFAKLIQEYETRQYKSGIKTADAILKTRPDHGETLAIKGLVLASIHQREEGLRLAKQGLRLNLMSFICWHALGIIHRMDRNYEESLKCYAQALRIESGNINLVRESAYMQLQLRNYAPLIEARLILLRAQPHLRVNWVALAIAHDLADNKAQAARVLAAYEDVTHDVPKHNYEFSEVVLYHASLLRQLGDAQGVLDLLDAKRAYLFDLPAIDELRIDAFTQLGRTKDAEELLYKLLERNPDNTKTLRSLLTLLSANVADTEREATVLTKLAELAERYPRSTAVRRVALEVAQTPSVFAEHARDYLERALVKGIPSLFSDVKSLYTDEAKKAAIEEIVEKLRVAWDPTQDTPVAEPPSSYLWAMYFLAHHYSYIGDHERALAYIDSILVHTPTMPELHMTRARVLKRAGAYQAASDAMEDARLLDGQDRYLNTKAAKYLLRANRVDETAAVLKLFTKPDVPDPMSDLVDMQAVGFLLEDAAAQQRVGDDALALKRYHQIDKILAEIYDDQLDFHSYCLRKMTLRAYVSTVHFEDNLYARPTYVRAAYNAIRLYSQLHDEQQAQDDAAAKATQRRAELATSKAAARAELQAAAAKALEKASEDEMPPAKDADPYGAALLATSQPLADAHRFIRKLQESAPRAIETWLGALEVAVREQKWLLALRALVQAHAIDPADPRLHVALLRFRRTSEAATLPDAVTKAIDELAHDLPQLTAPIDAIHTEYVQRYGSLSAQHRLGAARGLWEAYGAERAPEAAELAFALVRDTEAVPLSALEEALAFLQHLETHSSLPAAGSSAAFIEAARAKWPRADAFTERATLDAHAAERAKTRAAWMPPAHAQS